MKLHNHNSPLKPGRIAEPLDGHRVLTAIALNNATPRWPRPAWASISPTD
jgi:hypothetical protein